MVIVVAVVVVVVVVAVVVWQSWSWSWWWHSWCGNRGGGSRGGGGAWAAECLVDGLLSGGVWTNEQLARIGRSDSKCVVEKWRGNG
jgi:hypothetical protein